MAKYIMLLKQEGEGCDYTIGCGMVWEVIESENIQATIKETIEDYGADGSGEVKFSRLVFVPFDSSTVIDVNLQSLYSEIKKGQKVDSDEQEKIEYERLKQKFGDS